MVKSPKARLTEIMKKLLGEHASIELLREIDPEILNQLKGGQASPTLGELLAKKVIKLALDPKKQCQWAVELIFDRIEGKAVQGVPLREDGRVVDRKLDDLTTEHLNSLAAEFAADATRESARPDAADGADGPAARLLDLSRQRADPPEAPGGEPAVEEEAETAGVE